MGIIEINKLTKNYGNNKGVFDLSFEINKGEVFGYLGPNGAGKTTTIRHLLGFLNPDKGSTSINGLDCRKNSHIIQKDLGYLPGEITFMDDMTGIEFLKFMADMRGLKDFTKAQELIKFFQLDTQGKIKKMSKGMKQKLGIVCAFMHDPKVLILDEPTSGLDPLMQNRFVELILEEKSRNKTILMSSHSFEEVERTCDRVGIIKEGRLVTVENIETLRTSQRKNYIVRFESIEDAEGFSKEKLKIIAVDKRTVTVSVIGDMSEFINAMSRYKVRSIDTSNQNLEEIFMQYYGGESNA